MNEKFIKQVKAFKWQRVIDFGYCLSAFGVPEFRFLKGKILEMMVEDESKGLLENKATIHRDFNCPKFGLTVEMKSIMTFYAYKKRGGGIKKTITVKLTNSNGENKKDLTLDDLADVLLIVAADGSFAVSKETTLKYLVKDKDGYLCKLPGTELTEISGPLKHNIKEISLMGEILGAIHQSIQNFQ